MPVRAAALVAARAQAQIRAHVTPTAEPLRVADLEDEAQRRERADAGKPFMGLQTTRPGGIVRKEEVAVAKNYLTGDELQVLNRIVNLYIEYAELQALEHKPMTMRDWITKLDEFLKISGRKLLDHAGQISAESARLKAEQEYARYRALMDSQPQMVDADFEKTAKQIQKLPRPKKPKLPKA